MERETVTLPDGSLLYVDRTSGERGSEGPFFVAYTDEAETERWGYFCGQCRTFDTAMDTMGRIECNSCGNLRKPETWDAAHE